MEFGLFSNNRRPDRSLGEGWEKGYCAGGRGGRSGSGFQEIWFSEHQSPAELGIAKASGRTERIRLGSGVRPLGYYHPLQVALEANATDQLTGGDYMLGLGTGFYPRKLAWRGLDCRCDARGAGAVARADAPSCGPAARRSTTTARSGRASR